MEGSELRNLRLRLGFTQKELANAIDVTSNTVARWERGELPISELSGEKILSTTMSSPSSVNTTLPRQFAIDDDHHSSILRKLGEKLNWELFEQCAVDLIGQDVPGVVLVGGVKDGGYDGTILSGDMSEPYPLIVTTASNSLRNLRSNLERIRKENRSVKQACFATSRNVTASIRKKLHAEAANRGVTLTQIYDQTWFASKLYRESEWCLRLLGITGQPSALSRHPITCRPQLSEYIFGREKEIRWLLDRQSDCVVEGVPGSGKTFLLQMIAEQANALFLTEWNRQQIANDIRKYQPNAIIVDDAHINVERLSELNQLRIELNASDVRIIASSWPSGTRDIANALQLLDEEKLTLELIDADTIIKIINSVGITGPSELLFTIRQQAAGRPGLAVTLADVCLKGGDIDIWNVASGEKLADKIVPRLENSLRIDGIETLLAPFALGGKSGMLPEQVAEYFNCSILEIKEKLAKVATAGIIREDSNQRILIEPPPLRYVLVRRVFFDMVPTLDYVPLRNTVGDICHVLETLIGARARGACISDLERQLEQANSPYLWSEYASLGSIETDYVLKYHPELILDIAQPALLNLPEKAIPFLLDRVRIKNNNWFLQHTDAATRELKIWAVHDLPEQVDILARKKLLCNTVSNWFQTNNNIEVTVRVMLMALFPIFEHRSVDPGSGSVMTIRKGIFSNQDLIELTELWPSVVAILRSSQDLPWTELMEFVTEWTCPNVNFAVSNETNKIMRRFSERIILDLVNISNSFFFVHRRLLQLAQDVDLQITVDPVRDYDMNQLFPHRGVFDEWNKDQINAHYKNLAEDWKNRTSEDLATLFNRVENEIDRAGVRGADIFPMLFEHLANCVADPLNLAEEFVKCNLPYDFVRPFARRASKFSRNGWEGFAKDCLESESYRSIGIEMILCHSNPTRKLVKFATARATGAEERIKLHCQWGDVTCSTLLELLQSDNTCVAVAAAIGHWYAVENSHSDDNRDSLWQRAILKSTSNWEGSEGDYYWLENILAQNLALAVNWLCNLVRSNEYVSFKKQKVAIAILEKLDGDQRLEILRNIQPTFRSSKIIRYIVKSDLRLYRILLGSEHLTRHHLAPLYDTNTDLWPEKALLALGADYSIREIVYTPDRNSDIRSGQPSEWSKQILKFFESLLNNPDTLVRKIGEQGVEYFGAQNKRDRELERYHEIHGI